MKRRSNEENCEGWLSTRNKKKVCPSVSRKHPIAYKHATYSFVSTPKLTQNVAPLNQHQTSILKFVQKGDQKFGAGKNPDVEKKIRPDIEEINPDFGDTSLKNMANTEMNAGEFKQVVSCERSTNNECSSEFEGNLEKLKGKDFDHSDKKFSVETLKEMNTENVSHDLVQNSVLFDATNLSIPKTFSAAEVINFKGKNNHVLNKVESSENASPHNCLPKNASTFSTKNIKLANQNLSNITGLRTSIGVLKNTLVDCQKNMFTDCRKETHISKDEGIFIPNSDKSPNKKTLTERQQALRTTDGKMLPRNKFDHKSDNYEIKEYVFESNPQEGKSSCRTSCENNFFEEKSLGDSFTDFSKIPSTFPINSTSSKEILQHKVFHDSYESTGFAPISNACKQQDEKLNESNHVQSLNCDQKQWTSHVNSTGDDFEMASTFDRNTCQFDEYFESSEYQEDNSDEAFTLEFGNPDFTLRTQRNVDESLDLIPETEDFTFNSDSI